MITQIRIEFPEPNDKQAKGEFLEDLFRTLMERQRYNVVQRIKFTGTEIDLLCQHRDRSEDTALVECKAKINIISDDIKNFAFDLIVSNKARYGYFVHTSEIQQQAAGVKEELEKNHTDRITFVGPAKLIDWLEDAGIIDPPQTPEFSGLNATKRILLFTQTNKIWVYVFAMGASPSNFVITSVKGSSVRKSEISEAQTLLGDELQELELIESRSDVPGIVEISQPTDTVAEVQESAEWTDLRPVGSKFFVGRSQLTQDIYKFIKAPLSDASAQRVFFVEGKSGWGKSSLLAHLRARSRNRHNKNTFFVLAVDSRSANTSAFVGMAVSKLVRRASESRFIPESVAAQLRIASWFDVLSDPSFGTLLKWLCDNQRVLVLAFDQFEDVFRKRELFSAFHKLMMDSVAVNSNFIVGFSWKSEINIPIDNPAYNLWQQARDNAFTFPIEKFAASEIDAVINQLQQHSGHQLPITLRRRLKEGSQGFPWLIKKLATHCYQELARGLSPEDLVDLNLNVQRLFDKDQEALNPDEARALKFIAIRGYEGDPFDITEVDDRIAEDVLNRLLAKRLIIRTGGKYSAYWDIFRDYLVEGKPPRISESFLLRQSPSPCIEALRALLERGASKVEDVCKILEISEGTALNLIRELRNVGVLTREGDSFVVSESISSEMDFKNYMHNRLSDHVVVQTLRRSGDELINHGQITQTLMQEYSSFSFEQKTWETYANFLVGWLRYCDIDLGGRLIADTSKKGIDPLAYTPQSRPERLLEVVADLATQEDPIARPSEREFDKPLYDLKALGVLTYRHDRIYITRVGSDLLKAPADTRHKILARLAIQTPKIRLSTFALSRSDQDGTVDFEDCISEILNGISSSSYRTVTRHVLKSWARFVIDNAPD